MNKSSNQKGFAPIVIVLLVAVLVIAGAIGWFVFAREDSEPAGSADTTETTGETEEMDESSFSGTYLDAIERGNPLQCQWRLPEEVASGNQVGQGEFYTDGQSRGYSEATFEADGTSTTVYAVFDPEFVYSWFEVPGAGVQGTKYPVSTIESSDDELTEAEKQQGQDFRANYSFSCQPWTVDENLLTPPSDVTFHEITTP